MSLERQIPDHILSPGLAHCTSDSAVGQPLIGATWVGKYPRVCQWHARTRRWLDTWRQGTTWAGLPPSRPPLQPHPSRPTYTHAYTHSSSFAPPPSHFLPSRNNTMFLILSQRSLSVSAEQSCSHTAMLRVCVYVWVCICFVHLQVFF